MRAYMQEHEQKIRAALAGAQAQDWKALAALHEAMIARMQHERLIHLLVTLFFGLVVFLVLGMALMLQDSALPVMQRSGLWLLLVLVTGLEAAYVVHYFHLENGVQRWYRLGDALREKSE